MKKLIFDPGGGLDELQIKVCSFSGPPFFYFLVKAHQAYKEIIMARKLYELGVFQWGYTSWSMSTHY